MIGLYDDDGNRLAIELPWYGLILNDPDDPDDDVYEVHGVTTQPSFDFSVDSSAANHGSIVSPAHRTFYVVRLDGIIRAPSLAKLFDKKRDLIAATDPAITSRFESDTIGFVNLDFSVPTTDTANWATGLVPSRYLVRARGNVVPPDSIYHGTSEYFALDLLVKDPRRVSQSTATIINNASGTNLGDSPAAASIQFIMSGAGHASFTIQRTAPGGDVKSLVLNLSSLVNTDVVDIDMDTREILVDGADAAELWVSGDFFDIAPGNNTLAYTNTTNVGTRVLTYRHSWIA